MSSDKYRVDMCSGPLFRKIVIYTLPLMATVVLQNIFSAADLIVVGRYATYKDVAAVGSCLPVCSLIINIFFGISVGAGVLVANAVGAKDGRRISRSLHTAMLFAASGGIFLMVSGGIAAYPLLKLMDTPDDVIRGAMWYMFIYSLGIPALSLYGYGSAIMRAMGDTRRPLIYLIFSGIINVVLNFVLVVFFNLGVIGVAVATVVSFGISAVLIIRAMMNMRGAFQLKIDLLKIDRPTLFEMLRIGLPAGINGSAFAITNFIIQGAINSFGSAAMAGSAAVVNVECIIWALVFSITQTATNFASQNVGAGNYPRVKRSAFYCAGSSAVIVGIVGILCCVFGEKLIGICSSDAEVIRWGMQRGVVVFLSYCLCGIMESINGTLRGMGYSFEPMLFSIFGVCIVRIMWVWLVFPLCRSVSVLMLSYPVSYIITIMFAGTYLHRAFRKHIPDVKSKYATLAGAAHAE